VATFAVHALRGAIDAPSSAGSNSTRWDAVPRAGERLVEPIRLPHCGMPIVEWLS
jgi:hypothetical protein